MAISKDDMRKLQVLQNKTLRLITGEDYNTPTATLLKLTKMMSVHQLVACQVFKIKQAKLPKYHYDRLFPEVVLDQQIGTRCQESTITRVEFDLSLARSSFFYQGSQIWRTLPSSITTATKLSQFKKLCRIWVINNVSIKTM